MHPITRRDGVTVRKLPDELLVYVPETHQAHCLNRSAALVWQNCNGKTSKAELARLLSRELNIGAADERLVEVALHELQKAGLLLSGTRRPTLSRRDALAKLGVGLAALPVVMSVVAPEAQAHASPATTTTIINEGNSDTINNNTINNTTDASTNVTNTTTTVNGDVTGGNTTTGSTTGGNTNVTN